MELKEQMAVLDQIFDAISVLIQRADLQEPDAARLSAFYPMWDKSKAYGNGTLLRWRTNESGKPLLYAASKNITANGGAPDVTPGSYRLIG